MVNLLLHMDVTIVLVSLIFLHGLACLFKLLFDLVEDLLQLVEVLTPPRLKL